MTFRDDAATVLSTVDGVTGYAFRPSTPKTGDAWLQLSGLERADASMFLAQWRVLVMLPGDERAASIWFDDHWQDLVDALEDGDVAFVDNVSPVNLDASPNQSFGMMIEMHRE